MKYKVGDRVKVRKDIKAEETYGSYLICNDSMEKKAGLVVTIKECDNVFGRYKIDADDWNWCDEMFEGLAVDKYKAPSIVKRINDKHNILNGLLNSDGSVDGKKVEDNVKLYTWQDLCDYEILLHEKWRIVNEQRQEQYLGHKSIMQMLRGEYLDAIKRTTGKLGREVLKSKAKELGFEV